MPARLTLNFLGSPQLYLNQKPVATERRKALALLGYLAVEGGRHTRDSLSVLLWPDYDQSRAFTNLRQESGNRMSYLWAQNRLGYVLLRAGNLTEAQQLLMDAAQNFKRDGYAMGVVFALEGMADLFVSVGKPESAARLIGWADAKREKIHDPRPPVEQPDVDRIIAGCLATLGELAFSDAYDQGQMMTLDEAVRLALGEEAVTLK